jgi:hypothetical protein
MEARGFDPHLERIADRIVLGMMLAALVVAGGFVVSEYRPGAPGDLLEVVLLGESRLLALNGGLSGATVWATVA